ncbi:hypothetical protein DMN91_006692 [Ooceraea biroi]|uniref:Uncharacterized protein n=1 Tax=Ooceraea biroi TaxID=2015173 RepID=A0A026W9J5_OOCBI|nr:uncharacterized protein LOC105282103 [Ooceraea biroi]EZA52346.1 hypothetical protein X777_09016 [Ooceraea biroi]RLU20086.1 hypothetical protein DMN91_006692 [Ooceraea biroi]
MTPLFCWVFLLALVGRAASLPAPLVNDACALVCNPGAETEGERERRERDPNQYPRYPKGVCKLQSKSDHDQAKVLVSHCLKLCANDLSEASELNCFVLRSSIESELGCYCPALVPLSPNTMRLHENWRITHLVNELAKDLVSNIFNSPIEQGVICELHQETFPISVAVEGQIGAKCRSYSTETTTESEQRSKRDAGEGIFMEKLRDSIRHPEEKENIAEPQKEDIKYTSPERVMESTTEHFLEELEDSIKPMTYFERMDYSRYCEVSCRSSKPDSQCQCEQWKQQQKKQKL